jgi:hypothetical protein
MEPTLYIHVGPPKTATTYLQNSFLSKLKGIDCIVRPRVKIGGHSIYLHRLFVYSVDIWSDVGREVFKKVSKNSIDNGRDLIISSEGFYGGFSVPRPWYKSRAKNLTNRVNGLWSTSGSPYADTFARHLEELRGVSRDIGFKELKMVGTMRRQDQKMASGYAEMSSSIKGASQEHFEEWVSYILESPTGYYGLGGSKLDYYSWWVKSTQKIGRENVLILPVELLNEDKNLFLKKWMKFLNLKDESVYDRVDESKKRTNCGGENVWYLRPPSRSLDSLPQRIMSKIGAKKIIGKFFGTRFRGKKIELKKSTINKILEKYKESNKKMDKVIGKVSLKKHKYF